MSHVVLTSCTNRKRVVPGAGLRARDLVFGSLKEVAKDWALRLRRADGRVKVVDLYCGRAFRDARAVSANDSLFVVSAGLGLVSGLTHVPAYNLTVSERSEDNVLTLVSDASNATDWWAEISRRSIFNTPLTRVAARHHGLLLLALPAPYLRMLGRDFETLPKSSLRRLRVFTRSASAAPEVVRPYVMPYDARLDGGVSGLRGTHGDFAQRALRHFVEFVASDAPSLSAKRHWERADALLSRFKAPAASHRARVPDAEIERLIRLHWDSLEGQSTRMLRYLRDQLHVACEQSRFRDLFQAAKASRAVAT